jgi:thioredoxin-dependent peroxiredoxin
MDKLNIGDSAPEFTLLNQAEQEVSLTQFRGQKVLIYFYPKAMTTGCTIQSCTVRNAVKRNSTIKGIAVLGISPDSPELQQRFITRNELNFPLLADKGHKVAEAYGAWGEKNMSGKISTGIIRSSFLIDEAGKLIGVWYKVKPKDTIPKALEVLEG